MERRRFLGGIALGCVVAPLAAHAQPGAKVPRVGVLSGGQYESAEIQGIVNAFLEGLRERGYLDGQNIIIEYRSTGGSVDRAAVVASEFVRLKVDVILTGASPLVRAVRQVTTTIPIVSTVMGNPVEDGFAASLGRPGGNVTGLTTLGDELVPKRLELLKTMLPTVSRAAILWNRDTFGERTMKEVLSEAEAVARTMGVQLALVEVRGPGELEEAFSAIARARSNALVVLPSPMLFFARPRIVELAAEQRLPTMHSGREFVVIGGLFSYGPSLTDLFRRSAAYVDKIFRGAKPGDLPIEQPSKFELVINLKTAKALGITVPQALLVRADEVIQ
jgi:putative ABC transport system substrate-binding protein